MTSPLATLGAIKTGGRYNKKGQFAALYLADTPATALAEVQMLKLTDNRLMGVKGSPRVLASIDYRLRAVLDLNDLCTQTALDTNLEELRAEWVLKQGIGIALRGNRVPINPATRIIPTCTKAPGTSTAAASASKARGLSGVRLRAIPITA